MFRICVHTHLANQVRIVVTFSMRGWERCRCKGRTCPNPPQLQYLWSVLLGFLLHETRCTLQSAVEPSRIDSGGNICFRKHFVSKNVWLSCVPCGIFHVYS